MEEHKDPGWRKLAVWALVYFLGAGMLAFGRLGTNGQVLDMPPNLMHMILEVTRAFFYINGGIHAIRAGAAAHASRKPN